MIGIDLGGTKILVGVVDANNEILGRSKRSTPAREGGPAIVAAMMRAVEDALGQAGLTAGAIGRRQRLGLPGPSTPTRARSS